MMSEDQEPAIARSFDDIADSPMFPSDLQPDDFELIAARDWLGDVNDRLVLDIGCAKGRFVRALSRLGGRVVGADASWKMIRIASQGAAGSPFVHATVTRLPFRESVYDGVICIEVIEHVPDIDQAIAEIARVLKPGGRAVLIDKNLLGLGYHRLYPNWLYLRILNRSGRGSYPREFPFSERWYAPWTVRRRLRRHFKQVEVRYLEGRVKGRRRFLLAPLYRLIPLLRPDIAWCGRK